MREVCKGSAVVAAVVAVLEKQNLNGTRRFPATSKTVLSSTRERAMPESEGSPSQNSLYGDDQLSFESAVKDFDSVAEDVEKICATDSLKRVRNAETEHRVQNGGFVAGDGGGSSDETDSDEGSDSESDSEEEREHVISEGLATIAEELSSAQSYQGTALFFLYYF